MNSARRSLSAMGKKGRQPGGVRRILTTEERPRRRRGSPANLRGSVREALPPAAPLCRRCWEGRADGSAASTARICRRSSSPVGPLHHRRRELQIALVSPLPALWFPIWGKCWDVPYVGGHSPQVTWPTWGVGWWWIEGRATQPIAGRDRWADDKRFP
jgi:hypothetical protein